GAGEPALRRPTPADDGRQPLPRPAGVGGRAPRAVLRARGRAARGARPPARRAVRAGGGRLGRGQVVAVPRGGGPERGGGGDRARASLVVRGDDPGSPPPARARVDPGVVL